MHFAISLCMQSVFWALVGFSVGNLDRRFWQSESLITRLLACAVNLSWCLSVVFSVLIPFGLFRPLPALMCALLIYCGTTRLSFCEKPPEKGLFEGILAAVEKIWKNGFLIKLVLSVFIFFCFFHLFIGLFLPVTAWDTFTYHGLKSSSWVQTGGWLTLDAPGAWESYRSFFGGGEIFNAWAKLFLSSDLFEGLPDVVFWFFLVLSVYAVSVQSGMQQTTAVAVSVAMVCNFEFNRWVNCAYVDTQATFLILAGFFFFVQYFRFRRTVFCATAFAALGVAASIKVNALGIAFAGIGLFFVIEFYQTGWRSGRHLVWLLLTAAPVIQWLIFNYHITGYPFGCAPMKIGNIVLGALPPNLEWFFDRPDLSPYEFYSETLAFLISAAGFGVSLIFPSLAFPLLLGELSRRKNEMILGLGLLIACFGLYFSPSFSVIRLGWPELNGRFIAPGLILIVCLSLYRFEQLRIGTLFLKIIASLSCLKSMHSFLFQRVWGKELVEVYLVCLALGSTLAVLVFFLLEKKNIVLQRKMVAAFLAISFLVPPLAIHVKNSIRSFYLFCLTYHAPEKDWVHGLLKILDEPGPLKIAYGYGPEKIGHKVFIAPFLGPNLKNRVSYITPEKNGRIVYYHPDHLKHSAPDYEAWFGRLKAAEISHFVSFKPPGTELEWAEKNPKNFRRLAGDGETWGTYRVVFDE